jgi:hypothetical protein
MPPTIHLTAKLLLALSSTVVLGSESDGTHDQILISDGSKSLPDYDSHQQFFVAAGTFL